MPPAHRLPSPWRLRHSAGHIFLPDAAPRRRQISGFAFRSIRAGHDIPLYGRFSSGIHAPQLSIGEPFERLQKRRNEQRTSIRERCPSDYEVPSLPTRFLPAFQTLCEQARIPGPPPNQPMPSLRGQYAAPAMAENRLPRQRGKKRRPARSPGTPLKQLLESSYSRTSTSMPMKRAWAEQSSGRVTTAVPAQTCSSARSSVTAATSLANASSLESDVL